MAKQNADTFSAKIFEEFKDLIRRKQRDGMTQAEIGKQIGYSQTSISQWLSGARGQNIGLGAIWSAYRALGGDMQSLLSEVFGDDRAASLISWGDKDPEFFEALLDVVGEDQEDDDYQKLRSDVLYYRRKKKQIR